MIRFVDGSLGPWLGVLAGWSIRWAILVVPLAIWFRLRPPRLAATRHWLTATTLAAGLALPLAPSWTAPGFPVWPRVAPTPGSIAAPVGPDRPVVPLAPDRVEGRVSSIEPTRLGKTVPSRVSGAGLGAGRLGLMIVGMVWVAGAIAALVRLAVGGAVLARLRSTGRPLDGPARRVFEQSRAEASIAGRRVEAASHPALGSPVALGGGSPMILVPDDWDHWPEASQRACLLHELAHLGRRDDAWKLAAGLARVPFWFHPAVAWLQVRLDLEAELACDEAAVSLGVVPLDLARLLLDFARRPHRLAPRALSFFDKDTVSTRISRLLEQDMTQAMIRPSKWKVVGLGASITALALAIGGARGRSIEAENPKAPSATRPASAQGQAPAPDSFTVLVKDQSGRPIEGATVILRKPMDKDTFSGAVDPTIAASNTATDGTARFEHRAKPGERVLAYKAGYSFIDRGLIDTSGNLVASLTLPPPRSVAGVVLDVEKKPVEGAEVRVVATGSASGNRTIVCNILAPIKATPIEGSVVTRTDPTGRFRFDLLPDDPIVVLTTSAEGKATIELNTQSFPTDKADLDKNSIQIELPTEARIRGRVVSKVPGLAISGRPVLLRTYVNNFYSSQQLDVTTDAEGRFDFRRLSKSEVGITLGRVPADNPWIFRPATDIMVKPGQTSDATIELIEGTVVTGSLVSTDGKPVAGLAVTALFGFLGPNPLSQTETTTDASGNFRFRLPSGPAKIGINPFMAPYTLVGTDEPYREVEIPGGVAAWVAPQIALRPKVKLVGQVVDSDGLAVEGAKLYARDHVTPESGIDRSLGVTDAQGRFQVTDLGKMSNGALLPTEPPGLIVVQLVDGREFEVLAVPVPGRPEVTVKLPAPRSKGPSR